MSEKTERILTILGCILCVIVMIIAGKKLRELPEEEKQETVEEWGFTVWVTPTPAADELRIVFVDEIPTATAAAPISCTSTPTPAPTATSTPEPTSTPQPTNKPKPTATSTPKPTKTPTPKPTKAPSGYSQGKAGTYKVEQGGHAWKPWARHAAIKNTASQQYKLQKVARTDENGLRYCIDPNGVKRFCVALGTAWAGGSPADIGRCFDVMMVNGATLHCCLGDVKKTEHSQNGAGRFGSNGELLEFQVDKDKLNESVKTSGDVSKLGGAFAGEAKEIKVFDLFIEGFGG